MIKLEDGPAQGAYAVKNAPKYLRAVVGLRGAKDVLDASGDEPQASETVSVYRRCGEAGVVHIRMSGTGSGFYATGEYRHLADVDGEDLREYQEWRTWVSARGG